MRQLLSGVLGAALILMTTACGTNSHPGEINAFDGDTFDSLLAAHSALSSLGMQVQTTYPKYTSQFNQAVMAYNAAYNAYALFRQAPSANETQVAQLVGNVVISVVALEDAIQQDLKVPAAQQAAIRNNALKVRQKATKFTSSVTLQDILTELEIAASIAEAVPAAAPYATLAQVVIDATSQAVTALSAQAGQPINLALIAPLTQISSQ